MSFQEIIKEICQEEKIDYQLISKDYCFVLNKNKQTKYIIGRNFSLNDQALSHILDDKYALYELCKLNNIPIIEHQILHNPSSSYGENTLSLAHKYLIDHHNDVVVKPNLGSEGKQVYHVTNKESLDEALNDLFKNHFSISICPFYNIENEYRIVVLDNEVLLVFEKVRPVVIGDGLKSIKELLKDLNPEFFNNIVLDDSFDKILKKGEEYVYDWHFNLSRGATAKLVDDEILINKLSDMAILITNKIKARFVTVDIIRTNNKFLLLEINSRVCINKVCNFIDKDYKIAKNIYKKAVLKMFEEEK